MYGRRASQLVKEISNGEKGQLKAFNVSPPCFLFVVMLYSLKYLISFSGFRNNLLVLPLIAACLLIEFYPVWLCVE